MLLLQRHHITDIFVLIDDLIHRPLANPKGGRPPILEASEVITILVWNTLVAQQKTLKSLHGFISCFHADAFPILPKYNGFLAQVHRLFPLYLQLLERTFPRETPIRFLDSTKLPVCSMQRMDAHCVAKSVANLGRSHQGWYFGFKLHASIESQGLLTGIFFSPASTHDHLGIPFLLRFGETRVAVADASYTGKRIRELVWNWKQTFLLTPPNPRHNPKYPMADWQKRLLRGRVKIETVFDCLKEHLHLVTSFPRSVRGYFVHYVRILLGYQFLRLLQVN